VQPAFEIFHDALRLTPEKAAAGISVLTSVLPASLAGPECFPTFFATANGEYYVTSIQSNGSNRSIVNSSRQINLTNAERKLKRHPLRAASSSSSSLLSAYREARKMFTVRL